MSKILIIEDERDIEELLRFFLEDSGYEVAVARDGLEGITAFQKDRYDLILLDIMLPKIDGFAVCELIRKESNIPVIMITALSSEEEQVRGLDLLADDYITKPFLPLELIARIKAQLRRYKKYNVNSAAPAAEKVLRHAGLVMKLKTYECWLDEKSLALTPTEFTILKVLLEHKGSVVRSEELFHEIWQEEYYSKSNNTITVHIRHLREKMRDTGESPRYIKTVWGIGYKIGEI